VSDRPDLLTMARTALAASGATSDDALAVFYLASARVTLVKLAEDAPALELLVEAREAGLIRRVAPKEQLAIETEAPSKRPSR
jgi:hypothetical protein